MSKLIPNRSQGNDHWPLPPDFDLLTADGQRLARVNAVSMWSLPLAVYCEHLYPGVRSLSDAQRDHIFDFRAKVFVDCVLFFDSYYLMPDGDFDPQFYDDTPLSTPLGHKLILYQWGRYRQNITTCARGFAKSTLCRKANVMRLVTRPGYSIMYATSTHDNATITGDIVKRQCYENQRVFDDFAPLHDYGGKIKPTRGEAGMGVEHFHLNNGSWHRCISAESRQRGGRARRYSLDDPEYDFAASTSAETRRSYMWTLLMKVIRPMVARGGAGVDWINTFISRRHFAWHAMQTRLLDDGRVVAADDSFDRWARLLIPAAYVDPNTDRLESAWREMWPATRAERMLLAKTDPAYLEKDSLEELQMEMKSAFSSEYMCKPGAGEGTAFGAITPEQHGYSFVKPDEHFVLRPWMSDTLIEWMRKDVKMSMPLKDFLKRCLVFQTLDTSYTSEATSDYKVCCTMAYFGESNELFVLDIWASRCREPVLVDAAFRQCDRWHVMVMAPEVVRESITLYNNLKQMISTRAKDALAIEYLPQLKKISPGTISKPDRIAGALTYRFDHGLIKLPFSLRNRSPWHMLFDQVEGFNPDLEDCGLATDDVVDCVAMSQLVVTGRAKRNLPTTASTEFDPQAELDKGNLTDDVTGLPNALYLNSAERQDAAHRLINSGRLLAKALTDDDSTQA